MTKVNHNSERADGEIAEPKIGKMALLPYPEQRPVQSKPDRVVAFADRYADPFSEVAAVDVGSAAKCSAILGISSVDPECERDRVAEQEIDIAAAQSQPRHVGVRIGAQLDFGKQVPQIGLMRR